MGRDIFEGEEHYRTLFAAITDAVFVHEIGEGDLPGRFLEVNDIACERLGYSRAELLTLSPLDIDASDTGLDLKQISRNVLAGERVTFEQVHVTKDGRRIPVEISAQRLKSRWNPAVLSLARDITERKNAEQALRESSERYRLLTELSPNAVTVTDTVGTIRMLNQRALAIYGHALESEVIGRSMFEWVTEPDLGRATEALQELFRNGVTHSVELNLQRKDGSIFHGEANASLLRDSSGQPHQIIIITNDLTPRLQMEEERLTLQKLEAVGRLAGGIAHDFNNLLQGVFGYLSLAKNNLDRPEEVAAMLDQASQALGMSINLTSQLLTFAKGGKPVKMILAVGPAVENAAKFALAGSCCDLRLSLADDLAPINADEGQIGQVIQNIVLNASQAMPEGGNIEVSAENVELGPGKLRALPDGGRFVKITIQDPGIGIPKKYLTRIFDPYFTTKQKGSGLGLATSFSIIKNHGGVIEVTS
ncbi:MAG: PAS domain S-box protein, partial [Deltaproteobacteria bacterium]